MDLPSLGLAGGVIFVAAILDARTHRLPNGLTYPALAVGIVLGLWPADALGLGPRLLGLFVAFVPAYALFLAGSLGGGDVKLLAALGALLGAPAILPVLVHAMIAGALLTLAWLLIRGRLMQTLREFGAMLVSIRLAGAAGVSAVTPAPGVQVPLAPALLVGLVWTVVAPLGARSLLPGLLG